MFTIANGCVLKGVDLQPVFENIVVDDGLIVEIAKDASEGKIIDVQGQIVCPTFLNAHMHIGDSIIKDQGYGLSLDEMVKPPNGIKHVALANSSDDSLIDAMRNSLMDMINSGISHFIDYREGGIKGIKLLKKAAKNLPVTPIILGRDDSFYGDDPDLKAVKIASRKILKIADGIATSGFGEITDEAAEIITKSCEKYNKISSIHAAESEAAQINSINKTNYSEIERAVRNNFKQIVHITNPKNNDLKLINESKINVVLCPRANATLSVGIPPLNSINTSNPLLGTDNVMFNSPNIFRELEFSIKLSSLQNITLKPKNLLKTVTTNISYYNLNEYINKPVIDVNERAEFFTIKQFSKNPYLSIINRSETKDIKNNINILFNNI